MIWNRNLFLIQSFPSINQLLNYILLMYAFFVPTLKYLNKDLAILALILWLIEGNFKYKYKLLSSSKFIIVFFLFILLNYVSLFWTSNFESSLNYINKYLLYLPMVFIFTSLRQEYIKYLFTAFLLGMFISEVITYGIYFDLWTTKYYLNHNLNLPTAFMSHLSYSVFLAFTSLVLLQKVTIKNFNLKEILFFLFFLFVFGNLIISGGRTGLLAFVIALFLTLIIINKVSLKSFIASILLISLLFVISYNSIKIFKVRIDKAKNDIENIITNNYKSSFGFRIGLIYVGFEVFKEKPLLGWGIKNNFEAIKEITKKDEFKHLEFVYTVMNKHFHNQYIIYATQFGLIGLVLFLLIFYYLSRLSLKDDNLNKIRYIFIFVYMTSLVSTEFFHQLHPISLFSFLCGIFLAQNKYEEMNFKENSVNINK